MAYITTYYYKLVRQKKGKIKMTKMKSKKITKSTIALIIMGIAMVAMLAFGGTFAYFSAQASDKTTDGITAATISLTAGETATVTGHTAALLPGETITAQLAYTDSSNRGTWIVIEATAATDAIGVGASVTLADITLTNGLTAKKYKSTTNQIVYLIENSQTDSTNGDKVKAGSFDASVVATYQATETNQQGSSALNNMGKTFTITFKAKSIQHQGYDEATALTTLGYENYTAVV